MIPYRMFPRGLTKTHKNEEASCKAVKYDKAIDEKAKDENFEGQQLGALRADTSDDGEDGNSGDGDVFYAAIHEKHLEGKRNNKAEENGVGNENCKDEPLDVSCPPFGVVPVPLRGLRAKGCILFLQRVNLLAQLSNCVGHHHLAAVSFRLNL